MREWRRCPGCGHTKCGACPVCFPVLAEQERQLEMAEFRAACPVCGGDHEWSDADEAALRSALSPMSGTDAERQLRHRWRPGYPSPFGG